MKRVGRIFFFLLVVLLVGLQFVPVDRRNPSADQAQDYLALTAPPTAVATLVKQACYDCHAHQTQYPWYAYIAPVSFFVQNHVVEGRKHLNFATWTKYSPGKQAHKLEECIEVIEEKEMPELTYTWLHPEAQLSPEQRATLVGWFKEDYLRTRAGAGGSSTEHEDHDH